MKNLFTSRLFLTLCLLFTVNVANCREQSDESIIVHLKQSNVSSIDLQLESMAYEEWLRKTLGSDATINWEVDDCGEGGNSEGNWPLCVTAIGKLKEHGTVIVSIAVGHSEKGVFGKPSVMNIYVEEVGTSRSFNSLHQLPAYLQDVQKDKSHTTSFSDKPLDEKLAINFAKNINVRTFTTSQPNQIFLHWIQAVAGLDAEVTWKLDGCDQVAISMQFSGYRDYRACVNAQFENKEESVLVSIEVGTYRRGLAAMPKIALVQIYNKRSTNFGITTPTLAELPEKNADSH